MRHATSACSPDWLACTVVAIVPSPLLGRPISIRSRMPAAAQRSRATFTLLAALLVASACGGGGGDSTGVTSTPDVAQVVVTGAPATTMLIGESATLVATATNASGGVIS